MARPFGVGNALTVLSISRATLGRLSIAVTEFNSTKTQRIEPYSNATSFARIASLASDFRVFTER
jgi:hypothetical protein